MRRTHLTLIALVSAAFCVLPSSAQTFLGKPLSRWTTELTTDKDAGVRRSAASALGRLPDEAGRVVGPLLKSMASDNDPGVRDAAATALADVILANKAGRASYWGTAEPVLRRALAQEQDEQALRGTLYAIGSFGPDGIALLGEVRAKLSHKKPSIRQNAAWALGRMGENAGEAVDALIERLRDEDALVRRDAATALGDIGLPAAKPAVQPLLDMVAKEEDEVAKKTALEKLINLVGPENEASAPSLYDLLNNEDPETAHLAAFVLAKIGGEKAERAVKVLREALADEEPEIQCLAAASLGNLGPIAAPAVRDLGKALREGTDKDFRRNCAVALALIGPSAKEAVPDLVAVMQSDAAIELRHFAAEALARIGYPANEEALPEVLKVLAKNEPEKTRPAEPPNSSTLRQRCIWCFFTVKQLSPEAVAVLTGVLDENDDASVMVRYDAARVLASHLRENAPDKAADWLLHMLRNENLLVYNRTDANVSGGGTESSSGTSSVKASTGGDARFMAAQALAVMGKKASQRQDIMDELKKAAAEAKDARFREEAAKALKALNGKSVLSPRSSLSLSLALVPKLLFGNGLRETLFRVTRERETEFRGVRSQTGVWERAFNEESSPFFRVPYVKWNLPISRIFPSQLQHW